MINTGDVFYSGEYELPTGYVHDTWFVIVCGGTPFENCLCLMGTSKVEKYITRVNGCNHVTNARSSFYIPTKWQSCFELDTCLIIPQIIDISLLKLLTLREERKFTSKGKLSDDCFRKLIYCLLAFEDDIAKDHYRRLKKHIDL